jgi:hypothetical protein
MKAYRGVDIEINISLTSALVGGDWSASRPGHFTPGERASRTHRIRGWVDPTAGLDDVEKRKFMTAPGLCRPFSSWSLYRLSYSGTYPNSMLDTVHYLRYI